MFLDSKIPFSECTAEEWRYSQEPRPLMISVAISGGSRSTFWMPTSLVRQEKELFIIAVKNKHSLAEVLKELRERKGKYFTKQRERMRKERWMDGPS